MFGHLLYVWIPPVCFDVWMPPVHIQHNESILCQTKGCPYAPIHLDAPHMFGCPQYVWMSSFMFEWPCMFGQPPHMFGCPPVCLDDVWIPVVHIQHKESMLCQTKGVSICPHTFGFSLYVWMPNVWMHSLYVSMPPVCLDTPCMFGCPLYVLMPPYG